MDAGEVNVKLGLDSDEFVKALNKAENEFETLQQNLKKSQTNFEKVTKAMAGMKTPTKEMTNLFNELKTKLKEDQTAFDNFNNKLTKLDGGLTQGKNGVNLLQGALGKLVAGGIIISLTKQLIDFSKQSVEAFREQVRAVESLNIALINSGVYTDAYSLHLQKLSSEIQSYSNYGDEAVEKSIALGQSFAGNIKLTDELIKATVDYAAATGQDLDSAFTLVGKSIGTNTNALARYGVSLDGSMSKSEKMAEITRILGARFEGQAEVMADSSKQLQNSIGDLSESFGSVFNPTVQATQKLLINLINWIKNGINTVNAWYGNYIEWAAKIRKMDPEYLKSKLGYKDLSKGITASSKDIQKANNRIVNSTNGINKNKKQRDKALDEYKKYIEQYNKLTNDYQATLEARKYVENNLNIDPIKQQQEYNKYLTTYQNYFSKMKEIATSGAKNKAEIQKLEEENLARQLQEIQVSKALETQRKLYDIQKGYQEEVRTIDRDNQNINFIGGLTGGLFGDAYQRKLDLEKWYQTERAKIIKEGNDNIEAQNKAFEDLEILRNKKTVQDNLTTWQQYGSDIASILNGSFENIIDNNQSFSESMKSLMMSLYKELIKMAYNAAVQEIEIEKWKQLTITAWKKLTGFFSGGLGGIIGKAAGIATGAGASIVGGGGMMYPVDPVLDTYHSGGVVPGTKEQIALVKGGERVLNPAENASYTSNNEEGMSNGINNIMMFNIKAWDGKDVIQTLKANSQTINQIVSSGIKNNNQGLRTTVQNI